MALLLSFKVGCFSSHQFYEKHFQSDVSKRLIESNHKTFAHQTNLFRCLYQSSHPRLSGSKSTCPHLINSSFGHRHPFTNYIYALYTPPKRVKQKHRAKSHIKSLTRRRCFDIYIATTRRTNQAPLRIVDLCGGETLLPFHGGENGEENRGCDGAI